jgi:hypothetical protein
MRKLGAMMLRKGDRHDQPASGTARFDPDCQTGDRSDLNHQEDSQEAEGRNSGNKGWTRSPAVEDRPMGAVRYRKELSGETDDIQNAKFQRSCDRSME